MNIYLKTLHKTLPRLLSLFNADSTSTLAGTGDRYHWGWKLIDFPNGTFQGAVHGLSILVYLDALPDSVTKHGLLKRINLIVKGLKTITAKNGSLDEALPYESSFCVTALVASDVLAALKLLNNYLTDEDKSTWLETVRPLIEFLMKQDEYHGVISNHLASAALAMYRWHNITNDKKAELRGQMWLDRILLNQSSEGWYNEYDGADPGYQSWCTTQLAQLHYLRSDLKLGKSLSKSLSFLTYAAHPDGSFGGSYGSRNTRFLLPGGVELLSKENENASALSVFAQNGIAHNNFVTLECIDTGNLVPFFNDYALAALAKHNQQKPTGLKDLPYSCDKGRLWFPKAGWLVDSGAKHYSLINFKRGGACVHFKEGRRYYDAPGIVARDSRGKLFSTQVGGIDSVSTIRPYDDSLSVQFPLYIVKRPTPGAINFIVLRLMSLTFFKFLFLGNIIKRLLVKYLVKPKSKSIGVVHRKYNFGKDFSIEDNISSSHELHVLKNIRHFSATHMASQGYWQKGDDELLEGEK